MIYCIWFAGSFGVMLVSLVWSICKSFAKDRDRNTLSPLQTMTVGVAISVLMMFIPVYYDYYELGDSFGFVRPLLLALHNTFRVFILDGEFDVIRNALLGLEQGGNPATAAPVFPLDTQWLRGLLSLYAVLLYVVAPVLTFTAVLSLFKNLVARIRLQGNWLRTYYVMSEMNEQSMALAESINRKKRSRVVFTDVFEHNEESDYELLARARKIHAICLKQDITHVIFNRRRPVEYFLIGENETENISQATKIVDEFKRHPKRRHISVFVFATSPESESMVDSIAAGVPNDKLFLPEEKPISVKLGMLRWTGYGRMPASVLIRRVDAVEKLVWNEMLEMKVFERAHEDGAISVLLVGMGKYGMAFFRNLIWFCQASGYRLELNVVDKRKGSDGVRSFLWHQCPELMEQNGQNVDGDACYSVEFYEGVDMESGAFDRLFHYNGDNLTLRRRAQRLRRTAIAVVAMGDDDRNIRVAMDLRLRFDRIHNVVAGEEQTFGQERVDIYSVVYDEQKTSILVSGTEGDQRLMNYKKVPFNIHFIGKLSVQYDYNTIYEPGLEHTAFWYHSLWVRQNANAWRELQAMTEEELEEAKAEWPGLRKFFEEGGFSAGELEAQEAEDRRSYEQFEYFRKSSMARALHAKALKKAFPHRIDCTRGRKQICMCENCVWRKKTEHMRWNAYMRMLGYKTGKKHISRAKLHGDLVSWNDLPWKTQIKD